MKLKEEEKKILVGLCSQRHISIEKVTQLLDTIKNYELKVGRRQGIYDELREIIRTDVNQKG